MLWTRLIVVATSCDLQHFKVPFSGRFSSACWSFTGELHGAPKSPKNRDAFLSSFAYTLLRTRWTWSEIFRPGS